MPTADLRRRVSDLSTLLEAICRLAELCAGDVRAGQAVNPEHVRRLCELACTAAALARELVALHNPFSAANLPDASVPQFGAASRSGESDLPVHSPRPRRVLVVDDDAGICELFRRTLQSAGYEVVTAESGAEGWQRLRSDRTIALVLLDLHMPEMDGWRFRHEQLADPVLARIPTVIVTGTPLAGLVHSQLQAADYLLKPISPAHLVSVVRGLLPPTEPSDQS